MASWHETWSNGARWRGFYQDLRGVHLADPIVAIFGSATGHGYWLISSAGGVFQFGDAHYYGSLGDVSLKYPIVGMTATSSDKGYTLIDSRGALFPFGDAVAAKPSASPTPYSPTVATAASATGGLWEVSATGTVTPHGGAGFYGDLSGVHLADPIVGMAGSATGHGYWLVGSEGGVFSFGDAHFHGSLGGVHVNCPIVGITATPTGNGYTLIDSHGGLFPFGDAAGARPSPSASPKPTSPPTPIPTKSPAPR